MHRIALLGELERSASSSGILFFKTISCFLNPGHLILKIQVASNSHGPAFCYVAHEKQPPVPQPTNIETDSGSGGSCPHWHTHSRTSCLFPLPLSLLFWFPLCSRHYSMAPFSWSSNEMSGCAECRGPEGEGGDKKNARCNSLLPTLPQSMSFDKCKDPCINTTQIRI